jgi:arylsulfatase A-like enzyme
MKRREFLLGMAALATGPIGCGGDDSSAPPEPVPAQRPNILFISIDDLNDWVGHLGGHPQVQTPNIDRLAARASSFAHAYCNAPLCGPSRVSALTGMYPYVTGVFDHSNPQMPLNLPDLLKVFSSEGYETRALGKVYHSFTSYPNPRPSTYPATNLLCSGYPTLPADGLFDWAPLDIADAQMADGQLTAEGIAFMQQARGQPFFLGLGYIRTHVPWYVPKRFFDMYPIDQIHIPDVPADDWDDLPPTAITIARFQNQHECILKQSLWASAVQAYLASISFVDDQIGLVLDYLDNSPHAHNTLVVLWSDNGFHLGEKFHWHKQALWEEAARVPLIIQAPGGKLKPSTIQQDVSLIDMFPTLLELAGLPAVVGLQGRSLVPLMNDPAQPWQHPVLTTYLKNHHAIRLGQWCYIRYENGDEELYDRAADPGQFNNLAGRTDLAGIKDQLGKLMPAFVA